MIRIASVLLLFAGMAIAAEARDPFYGVPAPVIAFAQQFQRDCQAAKLGDAVPGEFYRLSEDQVRDFNGDGVADYIVYKCMFGCSDNPTAFIGTGSPCPWGSVLMSGPEKYQAVFLPGIVSGVSLEDGVRVKITKPRSLQLDGNFCDMGHPEVDPQHVYQLTDGRFQLVGRCPAEGCDALLANAGAMPSQ